MLGEYWSYDEIRFMPIKDLLAEVEFFKPKFEEIAKKQEADRLERELSMKNQSKGKGRKMNP